jgi:hypothetical protein
MIIEIVLTVGLAAASFMTGFEFARLFSAKDEEEE